MAALPKLIAACIQLNSGDDVAANLKQAESLIAQAAESGTQLVQLPENFALMGENIAQKREFPTKYGAEVVAFLTSQAEKHRMWIIAGSILVSTKQGRLRNRCLVINPTGNITASYDKIHLFDAAPGKESYRESALIEGGDTPVVVDILGWRIGLSICFDLRFPALFSYYRRAGCDLLSIPAAFTHTTGRDHWQPLLQARAIETQCYLLAAAQCGHHPGQRRTWGHSMVVDPWGNVMAQLENKPGVILHTLHRDRITAVRQQIPIQEGTDDPDRSL
ncbi:MAG: carbon-nitrogen hydrolase family protein [Mariprofundales bacterium]